MINSVVSFPVILSDRQPRFQGHGVIMDAIGILCAQLTRDLFATAKLLYNTRTIANLIDRQHCVGLYTVRASNNVM